MKVWFLCKDEVVEGPFLASEINDFAENSDHLIWGPSLNEWKTYSWWKSALPEIERNFQNKNEKPTWHYASGKKSYGPFTQKQLLQHIAYEKDKTALYLWKDGMEDWAPIFSCEEIRDAAGIPRRKHPRVKIDGQALITHLGQEFICQLDMVSAGGCGIKGLNDIPSGEIVKISLRSPHFFKPLNLNGEIRYKNSSGMTGIEFRDLNMETMTTIVDYIKKKLLQVEPIKKAS